MSLVKKSDVKNHLSARFRDKIHLLNPESQPDATGFSEAESEEESATAATEAKFAKDFVADHSEAVTSSVPVDPLNGAIESQAESISKSAQG